MHILLIRTATAVSGAEIYNLNLIKGFRKYYPSYSFSYITNLQAFADRLEEIGIEGKVIPIFNEEIGTKRGLLRLLKIFPIYLYSYLKSIRNINRKQKIDLILMQSTTEKLSLTFFLSLFNYKLIWLQNSLFFYYPSSKYVFYLYKYLHIFSEKIIAVSEGVKEDLLEGRINEKNIKCIKTGYDTADVFSRIQDLKPILIESNIQDNPFTVGYFGTITFGKGIRDFMNICKFIHKNMPSTKFLVIGDGPKINWLKKKAKISGLSQSFSFTGYQKIIWPYIKNIDVFLFPTHAEGMPLSVLEAMLTKVPIVARDIGGNRELIVHGKTGYLFKNESEEQIADMVIELLQNPAKRKRMGEAARKRVQKYFSLKRWITEMHDLFEEVSNKNRR